MYKSLSSLLSSTLNDYRDYREQKVSDGSPVEQSRYRQGETWTTINTNTGTTG